MNSLYHAVLSFTAFYLSDTLRTESLHQHLIYVREQSSAHVIDAGRSCDILDFETE